MPIPWEAIGGLLGFVAAIASMIIGFLFKRVLDDLKDNLVAVKVETKALQNNCAAKHESLGSAYVPRTEIYEITRGLRATAEEHRRQLDSLHNKMDRLMELVKNGQ